MRFRQKSDGEVIASAIRMAERKQAEGCSPCAEAYRQIAHDPSRRRLLTRGLLGASALTAASLLDVSGVGAAPAVPSHVKPTCPCARCSHRATGEGLQRPE
jgi:hypothetical protein